MRGLLEISEWLDDLHYLICCEFNPYLYEIYNGALGCCSQNDWSIEMTDHCGYVV
jgi:hypothetical protein